MSAIKVGDVFYSNDGLGPLAARVVYVEPSGDTIRLERWNMKSKSKRREPFVLRRSFLDAWACGWKKLAPVDEEKR